MSTLKEKAKTLVQVIRENCIELYNFRCKDCIGQCELEGTESFAGKWVMLEDAEKEIAGLKHKLQQFAKYLDCFVLIPIKPKFYEIFGELLNEKKKP